MTENQLESVLRLHEFSSKASEIIRQLRAAIEAAPHEETCASNVRFVHEPPCQFHTLLICLDEDCVHGNKMGDACAKCGPEPAIYKPGDVRCHQAPCNCVWKAAALAIGATE